MKATQFTAPGRIEFIEIDEPARAPGQVLVCTEVVGLCGSDLHFLQDSPADRFPFDPGQSGHECVGIVEESNDPEHRRGDRVLVIPPNYDAFAEYLSVEAESLIPLPDGLDPEIGVLAQQLGTVIFCCRKLDNVLDKTVVVVGQGPAGMLFTMLCYQMGARQVIGLDVVDHRLETARRVGAAHTLNVEQVDPVEAIRDLTQGQMADVVIEAVGKAETVNLCAEVARERGEVAIFGMPKQSLLAVALERFIRRNLRLTTSVYAQKEPGLRSFRLAMDLIAQGRLDVAPLVSHRLPFFQIHDAFHLAETKQDGAVKVLLDL